MESEGWEVWALVGAAEGREASWGTPKQTSGGAPDSLGLWALGAAKIEDLPLGFSE